MKNNVKAILFALFAALFYAISTPISKILLENISPVFMASFYYFGAGIGISFIYLFIHKKENNDLKLTKKELPYTIAMVLLDIIAPILMMLGIKYGSASSSSLLANFEIVATSLIALMFFKEKISKRLWIAILLIFSSSIILSFDFKDTISFSIGSLFVILATIMWGIENNTTRVLSTKSPYQIVIIKGLFSGLGSLIIGLIIKDTLPSIKHILIILLVGFVAYGLSIFLYVKAQKDIGAAKTSAFYASSPFISTLLSVLLVKETITYNYYVGLVIMIVGSIIVIKDTLESKYE